MEYLVDYASPETLAAGKLAIEAEVNNLPDEKVKTRVLKSLKEITSTNKRDHCF